MNALLVTILFLLVILVNLDFALLVAINIKTRELNLFYKLLITANIDKLYLPFLTYLENIFSSLLKIELVYFLKLLEILFILFLMNLSKRIKREF
jgi:hypothetical protein